MEKVWWSLTEVAPLLLLCLVLQILLLQAVEGDSVVSKTMGIAPRELGFFEAATAGCKDTSQRFSVERLNDNFCDCLDGTDEPGTSACPDGKFYCKNAGYVAQFVFSSRINDGICDCCDGSDEYEGKVKCGNTCWEAGKEAREKLLKKLAVYKEGLVIRRKEVQNAKVLRQQQETEISSLRKEEKSLVKLVQNLKAAVDKVERQEQAAKEKREKLEADQKVKNEKLASSALEEGTSAYEEKVSASDSSLNADLVEADTFEIDNDHVVDGSHYDDTGSGDGFGLDTSNEYVPEEVTEEEEPDVAQLSKEEMGRKVASRWTGEDTGLHRSEESSHQQEEAVDDSDKIEHEAEHDDEDDFDGGDEDEDVYDGDNYSRDEDTIYTEEHQPSKPSVSSKQDKSAWWTHMFSVPEMLRKLFTSGPADTSEAEQVRKQYTEATGKLSSIQNRISELDTKLKQDFGKEGEFSYFYEQCFELKVKQYVYKVCPFKQATQLEGHASTRLGNWDSFQDNYSAMMFSHGDRCWNGPDRSLRITLQCGPKTQLQNVDEPSRCDYVAELTTPAFCSESRLQELQQKLDHQLAGVHDEL